MKISEMNISRMTGAAMFFQFALVVALFSSSLPMRAQTAPEQTQQGIQTDDRNATQHTFAGVIVKSGDKLVLADTLSKTSYQLDNQPKARDFLNKNVKVTGTLDPTTGTIRVSAIEPM